MHTSHDHCIWYGEEWIGSLLFSWSEEKHISSAEYHRLHYLWTLENVCILLIVLLESSGTGWQSCSIHILTYWTNLSKRNCTEYGCHSCWQLNKVKVSICWGLTADWRMRTLPTVLFINSTNNKCRTIKFWLPPAMIFNNVSQCLT